MEKSCYLSGPMTNNIYTSLWRTVTTDYLSGYGIRTINPFRGIDINRMDDLGYVEDNNQWEHVARDLMDIMDSNLILCNLTFIPNRQSIGTFMELGIANANDIPFIVVSNEPTIINHPFITKMSACIVPDIDAGLDAVIRLLL